MVALCVLGFGLFFRHEAAYGFQGLIEGLVIGIHRDLGHDGRNALINAAGQKFRAESVLQVVADVALAHGRADRERRRRVALVVRRKLGECAVNHADLGGVGVGNGDLPAFLDKICDNRRGLGDGRFLLRQVGAEILVAEREHQTLFRHERPPNSADMREKS